MAAQKGMEFLLKIGDGAGIEVFTVVGGFQSNSFTINGETVDTTDKDNVGWRELLEGGAPLSMSLSGSGVFKDDAIFAQVNADMLAQTHRNCQLLVPDFGTYEGKFQITSLEMGGDNLEKVTYSISLESAGAVSFAAL